MLFGIVLYVPTFSLLHCLYLFKGTNSLTYLGKQLFRSRLPLFLFRAEPISTKVAATDIEFYLSTGYKPLV